MNINEKWEPKKTTNLFFEELFPVVMSHLKGCDN